jgi:hypothetical protein
MNAMHGNTNTMLVAAADVDTDDTVCALPHCNWCVSLLS